DLSPPPLAPFDHRIVTPKPHQIASYYTINREEVLGGGRFGQVHKCMENSSGLMLAAKIIKARSQKEKEVVRNEIQVMNQLNHANLIQLYAAFESRHDFILVMEYVEGGELFDRIIDENYNLTELDTVLFIRQICEGLQYMHKMYILHLDLKPENILCVNRATNKIKIIDFGLARRYKPREKLKVNFGTPEFLAPEVINYEFVSFPTDMWSLGVITYMLLSGLSPFLGDDDNETLNNILAFTDRHQICKMAQCGDNVNASSAVNGDQKAKRKVAVITGITGQDGSYLAELLLSKGYETSMCLVKIISEARPTEIYNLAAQSHVKHMGKVTWAGSVVVSLSGKMKIGQKKTLLLQLLASSKGQVFSQDFCLRHAEPCSGVPTVVSEADEIKVSFDLAEYTANVDGVGTLRLLDAIKTCNMTDSVRFYQASTSELYGKVQEIPQKETTIFYPRSPYGVAKLYAFWIVVNFREAYNMFAVNGILFNHESPRRGENFVTRKISRSVAKIHLGQQESFSLGNLHSKRDWGNAKDT
ncbi:unnamed protein product, partial [Tetraodon nigroviridis]